MSVLSNLQDLLDLILFLLFILFSFFFFNSEHLEGLYSSSVIFCIEMDTFFHRSTGFPVYALPSMLFPSTVSGANISDTNL